MVIATVLQNGFQLPNFNLSAFSPEFIGFTINGYARILAVMTGIEVFANLVAAYDGTAEQRSRKAFNSLLIVMGTTTITMLVVGPAIFRIADPTNPEVSVFTQTMDRLLPEPLPYLGSLIGIAVLISAAAASAQGLQNLALGLYERNYIPRYLGEPNEFEVADKPVWLEVALVSLCFATFGTHEETYLAIYAAGVFILLSMTAWAVTKRLFRMARQEFSVDKVFLIIGTIVAALLTTGAMGIIFAERFLEGAWTYLLLIPILYAAFSYFRKHMGEPTPEMEYLGLLDATQLAGFGFGQYPTEDQDGIEGETSVEVTWQPDPIELSTWRGEEVMIKKVVVLLDGSIHAARALPVAKMVCKATGSELQLLSAVKDDSPKSRAQFEEIARGRSVYLQKLTKILASEGYKPSYSVRTGSIADATAAYLQENDVDMVILSTRGESGEKNWQSGGVSRKLVQKISKPILMVQATMDDADHLPKFDNILVALDGSILSERTLPYARTLANLFKSQIFLLGVPAVPDAAEYRAPAEFLENLRQSKDTNMRKLLSSVARSLRADELRVETIVTGSIPAQTIIDTSKDHHVDLIMMTSRGRGRLQSLFVGSVAEQVVEGAESMVLMMPIPDEAL
jgi:nucleotide-binding universal stress UspA family protein